MLLCVSRDKKSRLENSPIPTGVCYTLWAPLCPRCSVVEAKKEEEEEEEALAVAVDERKSVDFLNRL